MSRTVSIDEMADAINEAERICDPCFHPGEESCP